MNSSAGKLRCPARDFAVDTMKNYLEEILKEYVITSNELSNHCHLEKRVIGSSQNYSTAQDIQNHIQKVLLKRKQRLTIGRITSSSFINRCGAEPRPRRMVSGDIVCTETFTLL